MKMQMYETEQLKHQEEEERLGREKGECKLSLIDLNDFVRVNLMAANPLNVPSILSKHHTVNGEDTEKFFPQSQMLVSLDSV